MCIVKHRETKFTSEAALALGKKFGVVTGIWFTEQTPYWASFYWSLLIGGLIDDILTDEVVGIELINAELQEFHDTGGSKNSKTLKYHDQIV